MKRPLKDLLGVRIYVKNINSIFIIVLIILLISCNNQDSNFTLLKKDDNTIKISNKNEPLFKNLALKIDSVFSMSSSDNPVAEPISRVKDICFTDTTIIILTYSDPYIHIYDAKGNFVRNFGNLGSGPGESTSSYSYAYMKNDLYSTPKIKTINFYFYFLRFSLS